MPQWFTFVHNWIRGWVSPELTITKVLKKNSLPAGNRASIFGSASPQPCPYTDGYLGFTVQLLGLLKSSFLFVCSSARRHTSGKPQSTCVKPTNMVSVFHFASSATCWASDASNRQMRVYNRSHAHAHTHTHTHTHTHKYMEFWSKRFTTVHSPFLCLLQISGNPHILHYGKTSQ
jgi:hypothetical protein